MIDLKLYRFDRVHCQSREVLQIKLFPNGEAGLVPAVRHGEGELIGRAWMLGMWLGHHLEISWPRPDLEERYKQRFEREIAERQKMSSEGRR